MKRFPLALLVALVFTLTPIFAAEGWETNYKDALAQASKENKKVLIDFTGSDWCGWCKKLVSETFSQPAFKSYADKNLVLLEIDFPQAKEQSADLKKQNDALSKQYGVEGFPTLVLLDPNGKEVNRNVGYLAGGPDAFVKWVGESK